MRSWWQRRSGWCANAGAPEARSTGRWCRGPTTERDRRRRYRSCAWPPRGDLPEGARGDRGLVVEVRSPATNGAGSPASLDVVRRAKEPRSPVEEGGPAGPPVGLAVVRRSWPIFVTMVETALPKIQPQPAPEPRGPSARSPGARPPESSVDSWPERRCPCGGCPVTSETNSPQPRVGQGARADWPIHR